MLQMRVVFCQQRDLLSFQVDLKTHLSKSFTTGCCETFLTCKRKYSLLQMVYIYCHPYAEQKSAFFLTLQS